MSSNPRWITKQEFVDAMAAVAKMWGKDNANSTIAAFLAEEADKLAPDVTSGEVNFSWNRYTSFWPPRLLKAASKERLVAFFGAGLSIPSGLLSWADLLSTYFGLDAALMDDGDLRSDPLTLAELAAHQLGSDQLQTVLRKSLDQVEKPSVSHVAAAALRLPFYITTNYDDLFERAFKKVNAGIVELAVIANSADLAAHERENEGLHPGPDRSYLIKIHGCVTREHEHLILTRTDYRRHYRYNGDFFRKIVSLLNDYHVLFLGFSHGDPEVGRLIEDAIWHSEKLRDTSAGGYPQSLETKTGKHDTEVPAEIRTGPDLYSLQYGMRIHTPEVFAAKGIVALRPSLPAALPDPRTAAVSRSLADLTWAFQAYDGRDDLDPVLREAEHRLGVSLSHAIDALKKCEALALAALSKPDGTDFSWMQKALEDVRHIAGQGLYLTDRRGSLINCIVPEGLDKVERQRRKSFGDRPYFRQAQTFRKPFVSDCVESSFNMNSTFMLCVPVVSAETEFRGLLFGACQIGAWMLPIEIARLSWDKGYSFLLVDSNGVCLLPPRNEFAARESAWGSESGSVNVGYAHRELLSLSRRDRLVSRVMENVVPLHQDDDVLALAQDFACYSVLTELRGGRWKLAISSPIRLAAE